MAKERKRESNSKGLRKPRQPEWVLRFVDCLRRNTDRDHAFHSVADIKKVFEEELGLCAGAENTIRSMLNWIAESYNMDTAQHCLPESEWRIWYDGFAKEHGALSFEEDMLEDEEDFDDDEDFAKAGNYKNIYFVPEFSHEEIDAIIEAVQFSRTISEREAKKIISTLEKKFTSKYHKSVAERVSKIYEKTACDRGRLRENLFTIQKAIEDDVQISYRFNGYDHKGNLVPQGDYLRYNVSPYYIVADSGRYYLLATTTKRKEAYIVRIDLMTDVKIQNRDEKNPGDKRVPMKEVSGMPQEWDPQYPTTHVNMSYGEPLRIILRVLSKKEKGKHIDPDYTFLHDYFGDTYKFLRVDENDPNYDIVRVESPSFGIENFVLQFSDKVEVLEPKEVRDRVRERVERLSETYCK